jgi:hypothetical protein
MGLAAVVVHWQCFLPLGEWRLDLVNRLALQFSEQRSQRGQSFAAQAAALPASAALMAGGSFPLQTAQLARVAQWDLRVPRMSAARRVESPLSPATMFRFRERAEFGS